MVFELCSDNHISVLNEICKPLFAYTAISMFGYGRYYFDNTCFVLDTYGEWHDFLFCKRKGAEVVDLEFLTSLEKNKNIFNCQSKFASVFFGDLLPDLHQPLFKAFKIESFLWLIEKHKDYYEVFAFASKEGKNIIDFYLNHYEILEKFILYFSESSQDVINSANKTRLILPEHSTEYQKFYADFLHKLESSKGDTSTLDNLLSLKKYPLVIDNKKIYLTPKELLCVHYLSRSNTSKEIGNILGWQSNGRYSS